MTEQAPAHLMELLERRAEDVLACLYTARRQAETSQAHGSHLEQQNHTLGAELALLKASGVELEGRLAELEQQVVALEAQRLELAEENRELDEQNRELEGHNRHLQERLVQAGAVEVLPRRARQSKGLSALMGHYRDPQQTALEEAPAGKVSPPKPIAPQPAVSRQPGHPKAEQSEKKRSAVEPQAADVSAPATAHAPVSVPTSTQNELAIEQAPSPQALLEQWYTRYDNAFFKGHTRPLKVGIHEDLAALEPWAEKLVRRALACYVNLPRYLKAVRDGAERIDLAGQPAGQVDESAALHARRKLERLQSERAANQGGKRTKWDGDRKQRGSSKRRAESERVGNEATSVAGNSEKSIRNAEQGARAERSEKKSGPADSRASNVRERANENPAERMQRKLDALMERHSGQ